MPDASRLKTRPVCTIAAATVVLLAGGEAHAVEPAPLDKIAVEEAPAPAAPHQDEAHLDVFVKRTARVPSPTTASDLTVEADRFRKVPRQSAAELLTLAPGVFMTNHSGEGHAPVLFLRGFDAGEGKDIAISVDGMPINEVSNAHFHGYADTSFVIPELVWRLHVTQGPFDPSQGDFTLAASANYQLGLTHRGLLLKTSLGSFNRRRLLALWGPAGMSNKTYLGFDVSSGDGFGPDRAFSNVRGAGQVEIELPGDWSLRVGGNANAARFESAGVLRRDDVSARRVPGCDADRDAQFFCSYGFDLGGKTERVTSQASLAYQGEKDRFVQDLAFGYRNLAISDNFTGYTLDQNAPAGVERGDTVLQQYDAITLNARGNYHRDIDLLEHRHHLDVGYQLRHDSGHSAQTRIAATTGLPYLTDADYDFSVTNIALYGGVKFRALDWLVLRGGPRVNVVAADATDLTTSTGQAGRTVNVVGWNVQPRVTAQITPIRGLDFMVAYGMGTRSPSAPNLLAAAEGADMTFGRVNAFEAGIVATHRALSWKAEGRLQGYVNKVSADLVFDPESAQNQVVAQTNRYGAALSGGLSTPVVDARMSFAYAQAYAPLVGADFLDLSSGARIPYVPTTVFRSDVVLHQNLHVSDEHFAGTLSAGISAIGGIPLPGGQFGQDVGAMDTGATLRWRVVELGFNVTNMFDRRNTAAQFNYPSNFRGPSAAASGLAAQHFNAAAPRRVLGTLTLYFDDPAAIEPSDENEKTNHDHH